MFSHSISGCLVTRPLTNLKKACEILKEHFEGIGTQCAKTYHLHSVKNAESFESTMENKAVPINHQLSSARATAIAKNKQKIKSIADTIIFCGRQGIALRSHRDDWKKLDDAPHANHGNFIALLHFKADSGDQVLAEHLSSAKKCTLRQ